MVCGGNTPPKGPYTEHEPQKRAERGFARPYGIPYGILAVLVEYRTVLNGRAKSGGVLGDRRARDGCSRRPTVESLRPYGGSSCAFANDQSPGKGEPHRRLRSRNLVCSEPWGFQYGLAKSRTENRQVMGCVGNSYGDCRCGPPLPDELQKSWRGSDFARSCHDLIVVLTPSSNNAAMMMTSFSGGSRYGPAPQADASDSRTR